MRTLKVKLIMTLICCSVSLPALSAKPIDLSKQTSQFLATFLPFTGIAGQNSAANGMLETRRSEDFNQTLHIHLRQTFRGYPVFGGSAIMHVPNASHTDKNLTNFFVKSATASHTIMNGTFYQDINKDLEGTPNYVFSEAQAKKVLAQTITNYQNDNKWARKIEHESSKLMVYIDKENKAHWAFKISFYVDESVPANPVYLIDAVNLKTYAVWDEVKTLEVVKGGGYGGNPNLGRLVYDGLAGNLNAFDMQRDPVKKLCYLRNEQVAVFDYPKLTPTTFTCDKPNPQHGNIYWNESLHAVNSGYSPDNDAFYAGQVIVNLYQDWYGIPVLAEKNNPTPKRVNLVMHALTYVREMRRYTPENAYWNRETQQMYFGDGKDFCYPLTSLGIAAHEISHGFTEHNSDLIYFDQSGAMNESFSDIASQAAEFYVKEGENTWQTGNEVIKSRMSLRYFDKPSRDCYGNNRLHGDGCSLDNMTDYNRYVLAHRYDPKPETQVPDVHYSSGLFNRAFYVMANSSEWGTYKESFRKAVNVFVKANQDHWIPESTFEKGACGVLDAAKDYKYDLTPVKRAFDDVGIDTSHC